MTNPLPSETFADCLANDPHAAALIESRAAALIESRAPAHRASARRLNWRSAILFDPLQLVATLAPRGDVLTPATGAALGVLAEQIGRAA